MKNVNLIKFKMADLQSLLSLICLLTGKSCQLTKPLLLNKSCSFREGYVLKNSNTIELKCHRINVRFQGGICYEKFHLNKILNG